MSGQLSRPEPPMTPSRKRLLLVQAFTLAETSPPLSAASDGSKDAQLMNSPDLAPILADLDWDLHPGPITPSATPMSTPVRNLPWSTPPAWQSCARLAKAGAMTPWCC